jgi:hypothetical protein
MKNQREIPKITPEQLRDIRDPSKMSIPSNFPVNKSLYEELIRSVPSIYRYKYHKALNGESKAEALRVKCYECVGFEDVKNRVGNCTVWKCPLWQFRPYQSSLEE